MFEKTTGVIDKKIMRIYNLGIIEIRRKI